MDADLEPGPVRGLYQAPQGVLGHGKKSRSVGLIRKRFVHERGARAIGAVRENLQGADAVAPWRWVVQGRFAQGRRPLRVPGHHHAVQGQGNLGQEHLKQRHVERALVSERTLTAGLQHRARAYDPVGKQSAHHVPGAGPQRIERRHGHGAEQEFGRGFAQGARGVAAGLAVDGPARRIGQGPGHVRRVQSRCVGDDHVAVALDQGRGAIRARRIQIVPRGQAGRGQAVFVELQAHDPFARGLARGRGAQRLLQCGQARNPGQVQMHPVINHGDGVQVSIDKPGQQSRAVQVHGLEPGAAQRGPALIRFAHARNRAVLHGHCTRLRLRFVNREHSRVEKQLPLRVLCHGAAPPFPR